MAIFKSKKKEPKKAKDSGKGIPDGKDIFDALDVDAVSHEEWVKRTEPDKAYEYFETNQGPRTLDSGNSFFVQINRIREAHKARMGVLTNNPPKWEISGRGKDSADRERIKLQRYMMLWMAKESGLMEELLRTLSDFDLIGMAWLRLKFDKRLQTKMDTVGMTVPDRLDPRFCYPSYKSRKAHALDGNRCSYINRVTKAQFEAEWGELQMPDGEVKKIDIDKIFKDIEDTNHLDFRLNQGKPEKEKEITVVEYEYYRMIPKKYDIDGPIVVPVKQYRISLAAGYQSLTDYVSPINDLQMWQKILFSSDPMNDLPYSSSDFQSEKEMQDLANTLASMIVDNMCRQMNSPWLFLEGTRVNPEFWKENASKASVQLEWKYTQEMIAAGIDPSAAKPSREPPGKVGQDALFLMEWVQNQFDRISTKDITRGENPKGVKSGKHAQILSAHAMQPTFYTKQKLDGPLGRIGQIFHHHAKNYITDEMELPVDDESIGVERGITINRILEGEEIVKIAETIKKIGLREVLDLPQVRMVSIRKGEERISLESYIDEHRDLNELLDPAINLIENDTTFGNFNVKLTIDPQADNSKLERVERGNALAQLMINIEAPKTALKYLLEINEEPNRSKLMDDVEEEINQRMQRMAQMQQQQGGQDAGVGV